MNKNIVRSSLVALALGATLATSMGAPAMAADGKTTTRDIILGAAAVAGIATAMNVEHKHQLATTVQGYLPDGSTVYADGRVVSPNGQSWYPGSYGQSVACSNQYCSIQGNGNAGYYGNYGYNNSGYNNSGYNNTGGYYNSNARYNGGRNNNADNTRYNRNGRYYGSTAVRNQNGSPDRDRDGDGHRGH